MREKSASSETNEVTPSSNESALLTVDDLEIRFFTDEGVVKAVNGVSFEVAPGETVGVVGESGAGKSVTAQSLLRLVDSPGRITNGEIRFQGENILSYC